MRIYQHEKDAGLSDQMNKAGSSIALVTAPVQIRDIAQYFNGMSVVEQLMKAAETVQTIEELLGQEQPDLALVVAILVSTGWNLNDDIFTPAEVWKARLSPLHKPMNDNHDSEKILGHIVQSRTLDKDGNEIEVGEGESPPDKFDIEVAGVLYRMFPKLADRIDEIITKAKAGEMFVSMEAWFPDFGYGLIDPATGVTKLIERNESTAFLTKHLRVHGGSGDFQGLKIGRVLKDIIFGAQGFVDQPANPESVIKVAANKVAASQVFVTAELIGLLEGGVEDVDEKQLKELQAKLAEAQVGLESKEKEVAELKKVADEFAAKNYDGQIAVLTAKVEELTISVADASEKMGVVVAEKTELQKQLNDSEKHLLQLTERADKSDAELEGIRKIEMARDRLAKLSEVKKIDDEEATLAELCEMTDETFDVVLKYAGQTKSDEVVKDETKATETDKASDNDDADQTKATLDSAEVKDDADLNANEDKSKTEADQWMATARALCGHKEEKE